MSVSGAWDDLRVTFTGDPVTAVGGNFLPTDDFGNLVAGNIDVYLSDGTVVGLTDPPLSSFLGITSTAPISYIDIIDPGVSTYPQMDHFYAGSAVVPEPSTLLSALACLSGVGGMFLRRRR